MFEFLPLSIFGALQAQKRIRCKTSTKHLSYPSYAVCLKIRRHLLRNGGWSILLCWKIIAPMGTLIPGHFMSLILLRLNRIPQLKLVRKMTGSNPVFHPNGGILLSKPNKGSEHEEDDELEYGDLFEFFRSLSDARPIFRYASLGKNTPIQLMVMHPSGRLFFMGCYDIRGTHSLICYKFEKNDTVVTHTILSGHLDSVNAIAVHSAGQFMVSGSSDRQGILWHISPSFDVSCVLKFNFGMAVLCLAFHPEALILAAGGLCDTANFWEINPNDMTIGRIAHLREHKSYIHDVKFLTSDTFATASADNTIIVCRAYDKFRRINLLRGLNAHQKRVLSLCLHPNGRIMVSASLDKKLIVWWLSDDNSSATQIQVLEGHPHGIEDVVFDPSGRQFVSAGNNVLLVWE
jgi:WD40 repeat protein